MCVYREGLSYKSVHLISGNLSRSKQHRGQKSEKKHPYEVKITSTKPIQILGATLSQIPNKFDLILSIEFDYLFFFSWILGIPIILFQFKEKNRRSMQRIANEKEVQMAEPVGGYRSRLTDSDNHKRVRRKANQKSTTVQSHLQGQRDPESKLICYSTIQQ